MSTGSRAPEIAERRPTVYAGGAIVTLEAGYEGAEALATLGDAHPTTACIWHNLAKSLRAQDDEPRARDLFTRALDVHRATLGDDHPETRRDRAALTTPPT